MKTFKVNRKTKKVEYTKQVLDAVLDITKKGLKLEINRGYDWIDTKYGYIKLLIARGQVSHIVTSSDLMARQDYLDSMVHSRTNITVTFLDKSQESKGSHASTRRIESAKQKMSDFFKKTMGEVA